MMKTMGLTPDEVNKVTDEIMKSHAAFRDMFPDRYKEKLAPLVAAIKEVMRVKNVTAIEAMGRIAAQDPLYQTSTVMVILSAAVVEVHAETLATEIADAIGELFWNKNPFHKDDLPPGSAVNQLVPKPVVPDIDSHSEHS